MGIAAKVDIKKYQKLVHINFEPWIRITLIAYTLPQPYNFHLSLFIDLTLTYYDIVQSKTAERPSLLAMA